MPEKQQFDATSRGDSSGDAKTTSQGGSPTVGYWAWTSLTFALVVAAYALAWVVRREFDWSSWTALPAVFLAGVTSAAMFGRGQSRLRMVGVGIIVMFATIVGEFAALAGIAASVSFLPPSVTLLAVRIATVSCFIVAFFLMMWPVWRWLFQRGTRS